MFANFVLSIFCGPVIAAKVETIEKARPAIESGAPFADIAILQRQMKLPVWGWSRPGKKVTVEFTGQRREYTLFYARGPELWFDD
jgi:hypothetical protein